MQFDLCGLRCFLAVRIMIWSHAIIFTIDPVLSHNFNWGWQRKFGGFPGRCLLACEAHVVRVFLFLHRAP